jgi:apolipoprotein N-acyltransferase
MLRTIVELVQTNRVWLVFGGDDREERMEDGKRVVDYFNAALIMNPDGQIEDVYHKRRLVIFGEYIPLVRWLPFLRYVTPIDDGLAAGAKPGWLRTREPAARLGMLICFEDAFPQSARDTATEDTDFLVDITNDGWFSESAAQWQHAANASFRAVENGLPLVRCANNGLTCWVDACGRMRGVPAGMASDIYGAGFKTISIPLLAPGEKRESTFYHQHGDWFGWACVLISGGLLARRRLAGQ